MGLKAKGRSGFRIIGAIFMFIGICLAILLNFIFIANIIGVIIAILMVAPWILLLILFKLEIEYFSKNYKIFILILLLNSIILFIISMSWNVSLAIILGIHAFLTLILSTSWYFALSIYKKKKIIFILSGIVFLIGFIILSFKLNLISNILVVLVLTFICLGMLLILLIEYDLRKNKYLNYI
jgi:hypothetical protein